MPTLGVGTIKSTEELRRLADYAATPWTPDHAYFANAEHNAATQWDSIIFPFVHSFDYSSVIDLAAGHGRWSAKLAEKATRLLVLDIQPGNIEICRMRFHSRPNIECAVNNGYDLRPALDASATLIFSFDAMVHFDSDVVRSYLGDTHRALRPGGIGFFHHSNFTNGHDYRSNPASRAFMSRELFAHYAIKEGLAVKRQHIINWAHHPMLDCLSIVEKLP